MNIMKKNHTYKYREQASGYQYGTGKEKNSIVVAD